MYVQKIFEMSEVAELHCLMRSNPLASLIVPTPSGIEANNLPIEVDTSAGPLGTLRCHVGRSHSLAAVLGTLAADTEVLTIFQAPSAYISPRWYVNGQRSGKVLPSWSYAVAHACGTIRLVDDEAWLLNHLSALVRDNEARLPDPWQLTDAPADFVSEAARHIIGIEITLTRLTGKRMAGQQRTAADRAGMAAALLARNEPGAAAVARMILEVDAPEKDKQQIF